MNSLAFADTGADDNTFSLVTLADGFVGDESPVVLTVPYADGTVWEKNFLVGSTLHDFLCLGCRAGYFPLENLAFTWDDAVRELTRRRHADDGLDRLGISTLRTMRNELQLSPWPSIEAKLRQLQQRARFILRFTPV